MRRVRHISFLGIGIGLIIIVGTIAGVGGIVTSASDDRPPIGQAPPINDTTTAEEVTQSQSQSESASESPQTYAVTARSADAIDTDRLAEYGEVGTQADERIELRMLSSDVGAVKNISWVTNVRPVIRSEQAQTDTDIPGSSDGVGEDDSLGVQQAHQSGITGEDIEVGIIDAGFDPENPAIASNVVETRSFRSFEGSPAHGTSVAEIVTRTAPDSQLSLVSISTGTDTEAAINYLRRQDVDIIVLSGGFLQFEDDGSHILTDNINAATESGTLFVNAAGNEAQTHWEGDFRDINKNGFHEWTASGDERNALPDSNSDFSGGEVELILRWDNDGDSSDYKPYLYNPVTEEYIVEGQSGLGTGTNQYARISVDVAQQPLSLVIENTQGPANDEIEVIVVEGPREIQRNIPASSILPPADVPAALAVAAYQVGPRRLAPYSSRGPTDDGRTGIDVTGYTNVEVTNGFYESGVFGGTSAAAPYVGGVAALVEEDQAGDQSPSELTQTLTSSSDDILAPGTDTASGSGVVNAADAVDVAEGTLTGEVRDQENTLLEDVGLEVSLERRTTTGNFEQIRAVKEVSDGQYTFEDLATGEKYRVSATFQEETGSATIESLTPGTNTRDVVIPEVTLTEPSNFEISDLEPQDATVTLSEPFDVSATIENTGDFQGEQEIQLRLEPNGDAVRDKTVSLDSGVTTTVTFENVTIDAAGEFNQTVASVNDSVTGSLTVEKAAEDDFSVTTAAPETVSPGEIISISYTIENTGDTDLESLALVGSPQTSDTELTITDAASDDAATIPADNRVIFETVEPAASVTATLTVAVGSDATGTESLTANTTNRYGFDQTEVSKQTVTELTVTTETETPTPTPTPPPVPDDDETTHTTVTVKLDSAPAGLQTFNVSVAGPSGSSITTVSAGVIDGGFFQIVGGGEGDSTVTARGVDLAEVVGNSSEPLKLYEIELTGNVSRSELTVTATDLTTDNGAAMSESLLTVTTSAVPESETENPVIVGEPAIDTDGDGLYEDVNGDGQANFNDGIVLAFNTGAASVIENPESFDFDGDGDVDFDDAIALVFQV